MKRDSTDGLNKKDNWDYDDEGNKTDLGNLTKRVCKICGNNKAWNSRGKENPQYMFKCTKCGEKE